LSGKELTGSHWLFWRDRTGDDPEMVTDRAETRSAIPLLGQRRACYPGALEHTQPVTVRDAPLFTDWLIAFHREAVPHDPVPAAKNSNGLRGEDRFLFWIGHGRRVVLS